MTALVPRRSGPADDPAQEGAADPAGDPAAGPAVDPAVGPVRGYLDQVDVVRLLTFASVIAVHSTSALNGPDDVTARGTLMLLHFTRETFFVITGFVLFHSGYRTDLDLRRFWRRRFLLVGVPYVVWTLVYFTWHGLHDAGGALQQGAGPAVRSLALQLATGTAELHLYFLLVSMQVYLVFGLLVALVRRTEGHHGALLAAAAAYQLVLFWLLHDVLPGSTGVPHAVGVLAGYAQQLLPSYVVYVLAGALAAVHVRRVQAWVIGHGRLVIAGVVVAALLTEGAYLWQVATGTPPARASDVLQPVMVGWALAVTAGLLVLGLRYALRARDGRVRRAVRGASRISFGVFLVHPLVLALVRISPLGTLIAIPGQPWHTALLWLCTVVFSLAVAAVVVRTPLSLPLAGRRRDRRRPGPAAATSPTPAAPGTAAPTGRSAG